MTTRADIIARILDRVQFITAVEPGLLALGKPLFGQHRITLVDLVDIAEAVEDEFDLAPLDPAPDWSIDTIADLVMRARDAS